MEQLQLFDITDDSTIVREDTNRKRSSTRKTKKQNKECICIENSLMEQLRPEIKKVPLLICKRPYTIRMIPCDATPEEKERYKAAFYDENGNFRIDPPGDVDVFGGIRNRQ